MHCLDSQSLAPELLSSKSKTTILSLLEVVKLHQDPLRDQFLAGCLLEALGMFACFTVSSFVLVHIMCLSANLVPIWREPAVLRQAYEHI